MVTKYGRRAFTLVELLVVIAIIGVLVALLLPAIQAAREAARRSSCSNNLRQIGLGLHNYHDTHNRFPTGGVGNMAANWLVLLMPYVELGNIHDQLDFPNRGFIPNEAPESNSIALENFTANVYWCPSASVPLHSPFSAQRGGRPWNTVCYVGIAGASSSPTSSSDPTGVGRCDSGGSRGFACSNGILIANSAVGTQAVMDGTSNTIIVGEQSGWMYSGTSRQDHRTSSRWGGWAGPNTTDVPGSGWSGPIHFNTTTVRYPIGHKTVLGTSGGNHRSGNNTAIQSEHPGGAHAARADGSVDFLTNTMEMAVVRALAIRDSGEVH